ncbi:MAG TPA: ATP synthase F1 subunit gamma [Bacteroidia bacterium]|jgi:F-type H+-transporting ATPase subunit gamma|nr:ATP synthase F1 subunit gamma [Bacteroidia bacterium]
MGSLKEVRNRITSITSTQQITSAMKMVSAAKLRRAQDAVTQMRPYAKKLREILENLSASLDSNDGTFSKARPVKNVLLIVVTSNRGLAGAFNANIIKRAVALSKNEYKDCSVTVLCIGKKGNDFFKKTEFKIIGSDMPRKLNELFDKLTYDQVAPVAEKIMEVYAKGEFDRIDIIYNQFKNAAVQIPTVEQFLPVVPSVTTTGKASKVDYIFEPSKEEIVKDLIPRSLKTQIYKALLDSWASEHGARMTAMHKATDNAKDLLRDLKLSYNKARQAAITNEILEIVGGAEALNG